MPPPSSYSKEGTEFHLPLLTPSVQLLLAWYWSLGPSELSGEVAIEFGLKDPFRDAAVGLGIWDTAEARLGAFGSSASP